ncbi:hypothetical protein [Streptomyces albiflavescens]|uniref:hypothetical protein n=1 Tax=Streptomyces albiflavescens TaxID=1623582 RepID=UPI0016655B52|nr:hypothetical protein [Streptomyces albiflavescens]
MRLRLFADYFQLVLTDEASESSLETAWTDQALSDRIAVVGETCGVRTEVNVDVDVEVHVGAQSPAPETRSFDHVVEAGLEVPSGRLVVMGCTDYLPDAARTDVPAGWVRIRVQKHNLARAIEADIDSDESEETMERIRIDVWPAAYAPARVLKQWVG